MVYWDLFKITIDSTTSLKALVTCSGYIKVMKSLKDAKTKNTSFKKEYKFSINIVDSIVKSIIFLCEKESLVTYIVSKLSLYISIGYCNLYLKTNDLCYLTL